ncbi:MAG: FecR family protein [bacterium]
MKRRLEELSDAYFDGSADAEECRLLDDLLRDKEARKKFIRAAAMEVELPFLLAEAPERVADEVWMCRRTQDYTEKKVSAMSGQVSDVAPERALSWRRIAWTTIAAVAAAISIIGTVWYVNLYLRYGVPDSSQMARVSHVIGVVRVASLNQDDMKQVAIGDLVAPDCRMTSEPGSKITLIYPDGSRIQVLEKTRIMTSAGTNLKLVQLDSGTLFASIAPQKGGRKLIFSTPHAVMRIVGTQFRLSSDDKTSRVDVEEGKLVFTSKENNQTVVVTGKDSAVTYGRE